jgi:UDP-N-acetylglucosamine 2-epimerase
LGRLKGVNIIDCTIQELHQSITLALSNNFIIKCQNQQNIYGNGNASRYIVQELLKQPLSMVKKFIDIK